MRIRIFPALLFAAALAACDASRALPAAGVTAPDSAEYAVWSAALRERILEPRQRMAVLIDSTWTLDRPLDAVDHYGREMLRDSFPAAEALLPRFDAVNRQPYALETRFELDREYRLLPLAGMKAFFGVAPDEDWDGVVEWDAGWERLAARFPGSDGVIRLSRVAFSADGTWALMYFDVQCGVTCGGGDYLGLRRDGSTWRVVADVNLWAS